MIGLVIKPGEDVKVVFLENDYKQYKQVIGIDKSPITVISRKIGGKYYDLWVDDEGLFKEDDDGTIKASGFCNNAHEIIAGGILILNNNGEEEESLTQGDIDNISQYLKCVKEEHVLPYSTSLGLLKMKFSNKGAFLDYEY